MSIGTIHQTLHKAAAALAPAEEELVEVVLASGLLHADETSWPERGQPLHSAVIGAHEHESHDVFDVCYHNT